MKLSNFAPTNILRVGVQYVQRQEAKYAVDMKGFTTMRL